jgi:GNAT superfamily N-acetyltransferase
MSSIENLSQVKEDILPLLDDHWEEVAVNKDTIEMNPCWDTYASMEEAGKLGIFTARLDGNLIGYFVIIASESPHYKGHIFGVNDVIYLKPEYRGTHLGSKLITFVEKAIEDVGVSVLVINTKTHVPFDKTLNRLGFTHIENVYSKKLGK